MDKRPTLSRLAVVVVAAATVALLVYLAVLSTPSPQLSHAQEVRLKLMEIARAITEYHEAMGTRPATIARVSELPDSVLRPELRYYEDPVSGNTYEWILAGPMHTSASLRFVVVSPRIAIARDGSMYRVVVDETASVESITQEALDAILRELLPSPNETCAE